MIELTPWSPPWADPLPPEPVDTSERPALVVGVTLNDATAANLDMALKLARATNGAWPTGFPEGRHRDRLPRLYHADQSLAGRDVPEYHALPAVLSVGTAIGPASQHGGEDLPGVHDWLSVSLTASRPVDGSNRFDLPAGCLLRGRASTVANAGFLVTPRQRWPLECDLDEAGDLADLFTETCFRPMRGSDAPAADEQRRQFRVQAGKRVLDALDHAARAAAPSGLRLRRWKPAWERAAAGPEPVPAAPGLAWLATPELLDALAASPEHQFNLALATSPSLHPEIGPGGRRQRIPQVYLPDPERAADPAHEADYRALVRISEPRLEAGAPRRTGDGYDSLVSPVRLHLRTTDADGRTGTVAADLPCGLRHARITADPPLGLVVDRDRVATVHAFMHGIASAAATAVLTPGTRRGPVGSPPDPAAEVPEEHRRVRTAFRQTLEAALLAELPPDFPAHGRDPSADAYFEGTNPDRDAIRGRLLKEAGRATRAIGHVGGHPDQGLDEDVPEAVLGWVRGCPDAALYFAPIKAAECLALFTGATLRDTRDDHATRFPDRRRTPPPPRLNAVVTEVSTTFRDTPASVIATFAVPIPVDRLPDGALDAIETLRRQHDIAPYQIRGSSHPVYAPVRLCFPESEVNGALREGATVALDCAELNRIAARTAGVPAFGERIPEEGPAWAYLADGSVGERAPTGTVLTGPSLSDAFVFTPEKRENLVPFAGRADAAALGIAQERSGRGAER